MSNYKKKKEELPVNYDGQLAPQEIELEESVLGTILLEGGILNKYISEFTPNLFYLEKNKHIAEVISELYVEQTGVDMLTVIQKLKKNGTLEKVGGAFYVTTLTTRVASSAHFEYHLRILQQEALKRNIIQVCSAGVRKAFDTQEDIFDVFQELQTGIDGALKAVMHYEVKKVKEIHNQIIAESLDISSKGTKSGVPTGLRMIDNLTNGWQKSDLIVIAGRPSMGKTAAAVSMCLYPSIVMGIPVAIFSLEMSNQQLVSRMQSHISGVNVSKIVKKQLLVSEIEEITLTCIDLNTAPIYIDDTPNISLLELKGKSRKLVKDNEVKMIVVDYLQLMKSGLNISNREQEIAEISRGLKGLAKELNIPVIALSQLSRGVESRNDKKPMLSDLRESGQIEQDADMVLFCFRPEYYGIEQYEVGSETFDTKGLFMFLIAKHRNGELGEVPLKFIHEQTKLINHPFNNPNEKENTHSFVEPEGTKLGKLKENTDFFLDSLTKNNLPF